MVFLIFFFAGFLIALQIAEWIFEPGGLLAHKWIGADVPQGSRGQPKVDEVSIPEEALIPAEKDG